MATTEHQESTTDQEMQRLRTALNDATRRIREIGAEEAEVSRQLRTAATEDSKRRTQAARDGKNPSEAEQVEPELREKARDLPHQRRAAELDAANLSVEIAELQERAARAEHQEMMQAAEEAVEEAEPYIQRRDAAKAAAADSAARVRMLRDQLTRTRQNLADLEEES